MKNIFDLEKIANTQYSLSKSEQWAMSTGDPNIMNFVGKVNSSVQSHGVERWDKDLRLIMSAMNGDQNAFMQLKQRSGGSAMPINKGI